ncbi:hypothetical protein LCGC14_2164880, partial [marine sediment metagenome]
MKKLMLFMFIIVLLVGTVSAVGSSFEFDNVKNYDKETQTIEIRNSILGIPFFQLDKIAEYTLLRNTYTCLINCEAEGITTLYMNGSLFQNMRFENRKGEDRNVDVQIYLIKNISQVIWNEVYSDSSNKTLISNKSKIITYEQEVQYNFEELSTGTYKWKIKGTKDIYESIDWIGRSIGGIELVDWAWWDALPGNFQAFTTAGTDNFTVPTGVISVNVLIVGGGAGGGRCLGGGGGAGGIVFNESYSVTAETNVSVTIGSGGGGSIADASPGTSGTNSTFNILNASGGGGGGSISDTPGIDGGSGGGGSRFAAAGGVGIAGQGFAGGVGGSNSGGGGGGNQEIGQIGVVDVGGDGGAGNATVWGLSVLNLSCGGGAGGNSGATGDGGCASAGDGRNLAAGTHAENNSGSGGGGGGCSGGNFNGGAGGSGLVVVRWNLSVPTITVFSPTNTTFTTSTIFFNASIEDTVDEFIVNYNGTNITSFTINTTLEVEDGNHQLLIYANGSSTPNWGLNDTIFFTVDTAPVINVF